jgi:small subunit ribosomal protein S1
VIKLDRKRNNVVLSCVRLLSFSAKSEPSFWKSWLRVRLSRVQSRILSDYGAFIDLGGIDGLLHITDMASRHVRHPSEVLTVGQEVTAKVLKFDQDKNRVSLGVGDWAMILGWVFRDAILRRRVCLARSPTSLATGAFVELSQALKGWCMSLKWTGRTKCSIPARWSL